MNGTSGKKPVAVPLLATRTGETEGNQRTWTWVEPTIWTGRMLAALEEGVKGGKWYSLHDKLYAEPTLQAAYAKVKANHGAAGVDHVTVDDFGRDLDGNLTRLSDSLRTDDYRPQAIRRHYIPKPGSNEKRPLGIPTIRDRVAQTALRMVLEPIFERDFAAHSYGFRPGKGCKDALRRVRSLLEAGYTHVVDADLKSYFDTIPKERLLALVGEKVSDGRILSLTQHFLDQRVMDGLREWTPEQGTPQGSVISPLLSNIYLNPLDHLMVEQGYEMVRYADDFVVLCRDATEAAAALTAVQLWTDSVGLTLHPDKTTVIDANTTSFDFLGYRFDRGKLLPRTKSLKKFKDAIRAKTKRTAGVSLKDIIADINRVVRGWFEYFKHSHHTTFAPLDRWIRRRLRSILRKRDGPGGISLGHDHFKWPNAHFAKQGLFNLQEAHVEARQSSLR